MRAAARHRRRGTAVAATLAVAAAILGPGVGGPGGGGPGGGGPASAQDPAAPALPEGEGRAVVQGLCGACHSIRLVTQQGMSRSRWEHTLDWMVAEQGMGALPPDLEATVLDYLAAHFGEAPPGAAPGGAAPFPTLTPAPAPPPPPPS